MLTANRVTQGGVIELLVGKDQKPFLVHRELLAAKSPYFEARLKECWAGVKQEPIVLEELDYEGFKVAIDWMYTERLPKRWMQDLENDDGFTSIIDVIAAAYKVADLLVMMDMQNDLVDFVLTAIEAENFHMDLRDIATVFGLGLTHTPYYPLVLRSCTHWLNLCPGEDITEDLKNLMAYPQTLADMVSCQQEYLHAPWSNVHKDNWCDYHVHAIGERCTKPHH